MLRCFEDFLLLQVWSSTSGVILTSLSRPNRMHSTPLATAASPSPRPPWPRPHGPQPSTGCCTPTPSSPPSFSRPSLVCVWAALGPWKTALTCATFSQKKVSLQKVFREVLYIRLYLARWRSNSVIEIIPYSAPTQSQIPVLLILRAPFICIWLFLKPEST